MFTIIRLQFGVEKASKEINERREDASEKLVSHILKNYKKLIIK